MPPRILSVLVSVGIIFFIPIIARGGGGVWYREMRTLLCMDTFANARNVLGEANDAFGNNAA
jgi:hypothetical protein